MFFKRIVDIKCEKKILSLIISLLIKFNNECKRQISSSINDLQISFNKLIDKNHSFPEWKWFQFCVIVDIILDKTLLELEPLAFVSGGGSKLLHVALLCLYFSQVNTAALENVPLISILPTSTASLPQAASIILSSHSRSLSKALLMNE